MMSLIAAALEKIDEAAMHSLGKALSHEVRVRMLKSISVEPKNVSDLIGMSPVTKTATLRHLHILKNAGLIRIERVGRRKVCTIIRGG